MLVRERIKAFQGEALLGLLWLFRAISRPLGLRTAYLALLIRLIRKTGLFDRAYYLEINSDVAQAGTKPLRHYAAYGDREGRPPMPFLDPSYYRTLARGRTAHVNALLHYAYVGRYRRISPSPWFNVEYYLGLNKDVARSGRDPLLHYLKYGWLEGRSPSSQFDGPYYLHMNPDVVDMRINPLVHYLLYGRLEGRRTLPEHDGAEKPSFAACELPQASVPDAEAWAALTTLAGGRPAQVDVVVPVYQGRVETLRCLYSVLATMCKTPFELVVINDASPDGELAADLKRLAGAGLFTLLINSRNRGFVYSANRGMALHKNRNVILLNSDTEVYDGWLDRLQDAACRNPRTGTATPLSNNATICSYPRFLHDNPYPLEIGYAELDALTARVNSGVAVEAPTGVGFCIYLRRACIDEVGPFDEKAFGKGYGEENDFCQRALNKGWQSVIAADVFIRHWGAASFRGERAKRLSAALRTLDRRYPRYQQDVAEFIERNPLTEARRRLDWTRIKRMRQAKNVLIVSHNRGGGTERHIQEDIRRFTLEGTGVYLLRPAPRKPTHAVLSHPAVKSLPNLPHFSLSDVAALKDALRELGVSEVHTHSLVDYEPNAPGRVVALVKALGARLAVNLHDYKVVCPRINLADENGRYCGEPGEEGCNLCLATRGSGFGVTDIGDWRALHREILTAADEVLVPDRDVADRLSRYYPEVCFVVSPHEEFAPDMIKMTLCAPQPGGKLRVVVVGAISKLKGFDTLRACAAHARLNDLPLEFVVLGYSMNDRLLEEAGVRVTGKYQEQDALAALRNLEPHLVWLPSLWPETYSYTLSLALRAGLPVTAFDLGAIAARLRRLDRAELLLPLPLADRPHEVNSFFLHIRAALMNGGALRGDELRNCSFKDSLAHGLLMRV